MSSQTDCFPHLRRFCGLKQHFSHTIVLVLRAGLARVKSPSLQTFNSSLAGDAMADIYLQAFTGDLDLTVEETLAARQLLPAVSLSLDDAMSE